LVNKTVKIQPKNWDEHVGPGKDSAKTSTNFSQKQVCPIVLGDCMAGHSGFHGEPKENQEKPAEIGEIGISWGLYAKSCQIIKQSLVLGEKDIMGR